jgi:aminoglycoside 6'-N-acetyltransferase I
MDAPTVRPVTPKDREDWLRLRSALWPGDGAEHAREIARHFDEPSERWPQEALLATVGAEGVGLAEVSVRPYAEGCTTREVGYLEGWYVVPDHRGTGVGRALMRAVEEWARARGCTELASDADPGNEASHRAHAACGFEDVGLVRCYRKRL